MVRLEVKGIEMALSKGANTYNRQLWDWEEPEFPLLCQTCLGDNPYVRMIKEKHGKDCKTCAKPFTVLRWCPGARMRFKKTEVCQTCSQMKNICQTCLLDLEYDAALRVQDSLPKSDVNKEYYMSVIEKEIESGDGTNPVGAIASKSQAPSDMLLKLARTSPYYKRNRPHICSFWVKGECRRGEECPYRHDNPTDPEDPLADQNIRDRFYGTNDPVAYKLLRRYHDMPKLEPPEDKTITTLYVGGLGENKINEDDLKNHFYQFGQIRSINVVPKQQCGFVQFMNRANAESAAERSFSRLIIKGQRLNICWREPELIKKDEKDEEEMSETTSGHPVDAAIRVQDSLPKSDVNKEFCTQALEREKENGDETNPVGAIARKSQRPSCRLSSARTSPYCKRNRSQIWKCKRVAECSYRGGTLPLKRPGHPWGNDSMPLPFGIDLNPRLLESLKDIIKELKLEPPLEPPEDKPTDPDDPLADQNIRERYYATNDEVDDKSLQHDHDMPKLEALFGLSKGSPVPNAVRVQDSLPKSDVNKEYYMSAIEKEKGVYIKLNNVYAVQCGNHNTLQVPNNFGIENIDDDRHNGSNSEVIVNGTKVFECIKDVYTYIFVIIGSNNSLVENKVKMVDKLRHNEEMSNNEDIEEMSIDEDTEEMSNDEDTEELWDND